MLDITQQARAMTISAGEMTWTARTLPYRFLDEIKTAYTNLLRDRLVEAGYGAVVDVFNPQVSYDLRQTKGRVDYESLDAREKRQIGVLKLEAECKLSMDPIYDDGEFEDTLEHILGQLVESDPIITDARVNISRTLSHRNADYVQPEHPLDGYDPSWDTL